MIGVGRSEERCQAAETTLAQSFPESCVRYLIADLSLQAKVRTLHPRIEAQLSAWGRAGLDALVNNAGAFTFHRTLSAEGIEMQWAVNHLAPFLLTHELLPLLRAAPSARVITVSSASHYRTTIDWDDVELAHRYNPLRAYQQSKLANVLFTAELRRRLGAASSVYAFAADPGLVNTRIGLKSGSIIARLFWDLRRRSGISPAESARGIAALLMDPDAPAAPDVYWKHGEPVAQILMPLTRMPVDGCGNYLYPCVRWPRITSQENDPPAHVQPHSGFASDSPAIPSAKNRLPGGGLIQPALVACFTVKKRTPGRHPVKQLPVQANELLSFSRGYAPLHHTGKGGSSPPNRSPAPV